MEDVYYYPVDSKTKEILPPVKAHFRGGLYHIPKNSLRVEPLPHKEGFIVVGVFDEDGKVVGSEYLEDHRGKFIYDENNSNVSEEVKNVGSIKEGYTLDKPSTAFDKRVNGVWVTDLVAKYHKDYQDVNENREFLYNAQTDSLVNEVKKLEIIGTKANKEEIDLLKSRIKELNTKIKEENPWPEKPQGVI